MKGKGPLAMLLAVLLVCCVCIFAAGAVGSSGDPLVSVSYLYQRYADQLQQSIGDTISAELAETGTQLDSRLNGIWFPENAGGSFAPQYTFLDLADGEVVELQPFASFVLLSGEGKLMLLEGEVLDLNTGGVCADGMLLSQRHRYFAAENSVARIRIYGETASGMVDGIYNTDRESVMPTEERFLDVAEDFWAAPYIWQLYELGAVNGVETHRFAPGAIVTRGAFVTILGRLSRVDTAAYAEVPFNDVQTQDWYGPYVAWAAEAGITLGFEDGSFRPGDNISREQLAVMLVRYMRCFALQAPLTEREAFSDEGSISDWAVEAVDLLRDAGLMNGRGENRFEPRGTATRAEICAVVCRIADLAE